MTLDTKIKLAMVTSVVSILMFFSIMFYALLRIDLKQAIIDAGVEIKEIAHEIENHQAGE